MNLEQEPKIEKKSRGLEKTAGQLRLVNQVSSRLQALMDADRFFDGIVELIQSEFEHHSVIIWTKGDGNFLTLQAQHGAYEHHLKRGHRLSLDHAGITGHVAKTKRPYLCSDVSADPLFTNLSFPVESGSEICVPVLRGNEILACLSAESAHKNAFDTTDVATLEAVASQISVAMGNRGLYKKVKDFNLVLKQTVQEKTEELRKANEQILRQQRVVQRENKALKSLVNKNQPSMDIIGTSPAIQDILAMVEKIAPTTATVLIQGESGTGKELIARRLHCMSDRKSQPYVTINCGALQEALLESELFGHEKGSFTGANQQKLGLAEMANGGTLFLDEIGEMSLSIQSKLLRFLQEGEFYRIGGKRPIKVDVRIVSATNRDLEREVNNSNFREDLFYRINTITLRMPPLRKRKEDIPAIVQYFLEDARFGGSSQRIKKADSRVLKVFQSYDWPGNIRELQNTIERLKILADSPIIGLDDIPFNIRMPSPGGGNRREQADFGIDLSLEEVEKKHILRTLSYQQGNKTKTAKKLGITIKTLYNKLHRYGLIEPKSNPVEQNGAKVKMPYR